MAINLQILMPYRPSVEAARFDKDMAEEEMSAASMTFCVAPNERKIEAGEYYRACRERYHLAREILHMANMLDLDHRMESGGK